MRPGYSTITPATVHRAARSVLERALGFRSHKRSVTRAPALDLLLLVAATTRTRFAVARRYFAFSHETARQALRDNRPALDVLTARLVGALHAVPAFSRPDRRRPGTVATDRHYVPGCGSRPTAHTVGGPKKPGTSFFRAYVTAVRIHRRRRYTVGLPSAEKSLKPHEPARWRRCRG